ncbi:MAG: hypothetical protein IAE78_19035 [Myxococcus sp.]|nr:hypothetical protein [Myxococcus sp.]
MRTFLLSLLLVAVTVAARPKSTFIEIRSLPSSVKGLAAIVEKEKPSDFRKQALWAMEAKLREKGEPLTDPEAVDALVDETLRRVLDDMASASDIYKWEGDDAPRGDLLIREHLYVLPGRTSASFSKTYTVRPMGKRIDGAYRNTNCTLKVSVAKSAAEWFTHVDTRGWGVALDPIRATDGVARVVLRFLSKAGTEPASARHERPVWVGFFRQEAVGGPWLPVLFEPAGAKLQRDQETTLLPADPKEKLTDAMKQHLFAVRVGDLALMNPNRSTLHEAEARWTSLNGLSGSVVDAKNIGWLDVLRMDDDALVRAAGVLKIVSLGGTVTTDELVDVISNVKQARVQAEALLALTKLLDASAEAPTDEDKAVLTRLGGAGELKLLGTVARLKSGAVTRLYKKGPKGWDPVVPKR